MIDKNLQEEGNQLAEKLALETGVFPEGIKILASPYRICPLGAHIDHQGGDVLGMTIDLHTLMAFLPSQGGEICLRSENYPEQTNFDLENIPSAFSENWSRYIQSAAYVMKREFQITKGIKGILKGMLPGGGLSSSASVLLAYLHALANVNSIRLKPWDFVRLCSEAEQGYLGLKNGILDQTSITFGKKHSLLLINTKEPDIKIIDRKLDEEKFRILIAYSGFSRELTSTNFNMRVFECKEAAAKLSQLSGLPHVETLSNISKEIFENFGSKLDLKLQKRAKHFFSEIHRVKKGIAAWESGDMKTFGKLMTESCRSSVKNYENGSPPIHNLQEIVCSAPGVFGSRFGGGGFGGCVLGFVKASESKTALKQIEEKYIKLYPEIADEAKFLIVNSDDGVKFL